MLILMVLLFFSLAFFLISITLHWNVLQCYHHTQKQFDRVWGGGLFFNKWPDSFFSTHDNVTINWLWPTDHSDHDCGAFFSDKYIYTSRSVLLLCFNHLLFAVSEKTCFLLHIISDAGAQFHRGSQSKASGCRGRHVGLQNRFQGVQDVVLGDLIERCVNTGSESWDLIL